MIAYNKTWIKNSRIREEIDRLFREGLITAAECRELHKEYFVGFYSPNIFIRIGLFILTIIIASFSFSLVSLLLLDSLEKSISGLAIFFGIVCIAALELMVKVKNHFRSGIDDALLYTAVGCLFCGISLPHDFSGLTNSLILFVICSLAALRYLDRAMASLAFLSGMAILFYSLIHAGISSVLLPAFIIMVVSVMLYLWSVKLGKRFSQYFDCFRVIQVIALLGVYACGNYFIAREINNKFFYNAAAFNAFNWFFWLCTIVIPIIYILAGIRKKNILLLRVGLLLVAAMVFTIKYYTHFLALEVVMIIGGSLLFISGYVLMKILRKPKNGFVFKELPIENEPGGLKLESLVIAETFKPGIETGHTEFGGGGFGGAGASGEF